MTALLDFTALLAPLAADNPCGEPVPYEVRQKLEDARKEDDPDDYAPDDPGRPETFRKADWAGIVRLASETLSRTSKDLLVAARLTEALTRQHRFAGLRDGLRLMRELVEQHWENLYPRVDDGDLELRAAPFNWLDDFNFGARFPNTLLTVPLVNGQAVGFGWLDWRRSQDGKGDITAADVEKAIQDATPEACAQTAEEIAQSLQEVEQLRGHLDSRMGPVAPGLGALRKAISDCQSLVGHILSQKCPAGSGETDNPTTGDASSPQTSTRALTTRAEAYRQLAQAAAVLQQLEPHSPIPYLVRKAVELGELTFPELIVRLIRDEGVLAELNRELGIKPPERPD